MVLNKETIDRIKLIRELILDLKVEEMKNKGLVSQLMKLQATLNEILGIINLKYKLSKQNS